MKPICLPANARGVADHVEKMGVGWAQVKVSFLSSGIMLADGAELLVISSVTRSLTDEWGLSPTQRGFIVTFVFLGVSCGNFLSGALADVFGRRPTIVGSYALIFTLSMLSSGAWNYVSLCILRLLVGISFGLGQPACNSLCAEVSPAWWRPVNPIIGQLLFIIGEVFVCALIVVQDPEMQNLRWRLLVQMSSLPALFLGILATGFMPESAFHLFATGRRQEAERVLTSMCRANGCADLKVELPEEPVSRHAASSSEDSCLEGIIRPMAILFGPRYLFSTCVVSLGFFVANLAYYTLIYVVPQLLPTLKLSGSAATELLMSSLMELPGLGLAVLVIMSMRRITAFVLTWFGLCASCVFFTVGAQWMSHTDHKEAASLLAAHLALQPEAEQAFFMLLFKCGLYGSKMLLIVSFSLYYLYPAEIYPTAARGSGCSVICTAGRIGAMVGPLVYELIAGVHGFGAFFFMVAALAGLCGALSLNLPFETAGMQLDDKDDSFEGKRYGSVA